VLLDLLIIQTYSLVSTPAEQLKEMEIMGSMDYKGGAEILHSPFLKNPS
jgi:hypothetical protein